MTKLKFLALSLFLFSFSSMAQIHGNNDPNEYDYVEDLPSCGPLDYNNTAKVVEDLGGQNKIVHKFRCLCEGWNKESEQRWGKVCTQYTVTHFVKHNLREIRPGDGSCSVSFHIARDTNKTANNRRVYSCDDGGGLEGDEGSIGVEDKCYVLDFSNDYSAIQRLEGHIETEIDSRTSYLERENCPGTNLAKKYTVKREFLEVIEQGRFFPDFVYPAPSRP